MSMISTDTAWTTAVAPQPSERAIEHNMIVSWTRHRHSTDDVTYTYQFPLTQATPVDTQYEFLLNMKGMLYIHLDIHGDEYSVVWRMSETGQIAFVRNQGSFDAAVLDHKNANKKIIQLFVVKNDNINSLPSLEFSR
ncbi:hypothetical protein KCU77_g12519, partial [Aureobasidium melanogenum]